jgi:hypothetical protein
MRKINVHFFLGSGTMKKFLVENNKDLKEYEKKFPFQFSIVKEAFKRLISEKRKIIVHENGSYCIECSTIKIID